ncbi:MAG: class I SAM-dependent RNA methyltransferase [Chloroflexi bacterium]|nr:class I SAM-dependent RNA methyltransferase [Chloroflexota bacterium]
MLKPPSDKTQIEENVRLELGEMSPDGDTLAMFDGEQIPVCGGIMGEVVEATIRRFTKRRKRVTVGVVEDIIQASPHRVAPPCPYYGPCTGCDWQHIAYPHQLQLKRERIQKALASHPELADVPVAETLPSPSQFGYRNHARFTVRNQGQLGFVNRVTRRWTRVDECMLMDPGINEKLAELQDKADTSQLSIRYGINTDEWLIQPRMSISTPTGQAYYKEKLLDRTFRVASPSFFQVNTKQAEQLAEKIRERLTPAENLTVVDAYAGVGTFAVLLAPHVKRVILIEESPAAVKDAAINAIGLDNVGFMEGRTEDVLATLDERPDVLILDPPRVGCHPDAIAAAVRLSPPTLLYVSCVPETAARDLALLAQGGYTVENVEPVDMFPQTHHVECLATLRLA